MMQIDLGTLILSILSEYYNLTLKELWEFVRSTDNVPKQSFYTKIAYLRKHKIISVYPNLQNMREREVMLL